VRGDALPEPSGLLLTSRIGPELVDVDAAGGAVDALAAGGTVQIEDDVDTGFFGHFHGAIEPFEGVRAQDKRALVVHEERVMERDANEIEAEGLELGELARGDPVGAEELHELGGARRAATGLQGGDEGVLVADLIRTRGEHPGFGEEPGPEVAAFEHDALAGFVDQPAAIGFETRQGRGVCRHHQRNQADRGQAGVPAERMRRDGLAAEHLV